MPATFPVVKHYLPDSDLATGMDELVDRVTEIFEQMQHRSLVSAEGLSPVRRMVCRNIQAKVQFQLISAFDSAKVFQSGM